MFFLVMMEKAFFLLERNVPKEKVEESSFLWLEKQNLRRKIKRNFSTLGGKRRQMRRLPNQNGIIYGIVQY